MTEMAMVLCLMDLREAIEAQTARLCGEHDQWDESAVAKLASDHAGLGRRLDSLERKIARMSEQYNELEGWKTRVEKIESQLLTGKG
jgi:hypothetical protein